MARHARLAAFAAALLLVVSAFPLAVSAAAAPSLDYESNGDGTCTVVGIGSVTDTAIVIPALSPDGETVTAIRDRAFSENTAIRSVLLPETLCDIGFGAFYGCTALGDIRIPAGVTAIREYTFSGCTSLRAVTLPGGLTEIGEWAFDGCRSLSSVILPESLTLIAVGAFSGCTGLVSMTVPAGVTRVGEEAFKNCLGLGTVLFLSKTTEPDPSESTVPKNAEIVAYADSAAAQYAGKYGRTFRELNEMLPTASLGDASGVPGKTVEIPLSVSKNPGLNFIKIKIQYDKNVLSLVSCDDEKNFAGVFQASRTMEDCPYVLVWANTENMTAEGTVATLTFRIAEDAPDGGTEIVLSVEQCFDEANESLVFLSENATVTVRSVLYGDVNRDTLVDGRDATLLLQYLTGWDVLIDMVNADVNVDGEVDGKDATLLLQYLADWDVTLG